MNKYVVAFVSTVALSSQCFADANTEWSYSGASGPAYWGELNESFNVCSTGKNQSPINITGMVKGQLPALDMSYVPGGSEVVNNGHTIQVNYSGGSQLTVDGRTFELKQFHFHAPSENTIEGVSFPMEAHFVHADKEGNLAVVAVMYKEGDYNSELEKAWQRMPEEAGKTQLISSVLDANKLIPKKQEYYRFNGSLTTPPCSEGVNWFVMKSYDTASQQQIQKFTQVVKHDNNRPVQPVHARLVLE